MIPVNVTTGLLAHTLWSGPAFTVAAGLIVTTSESDTAGHGPAGSSVLNVKVTLPAAMSAAEGLYVALSVVAFGVKTPVPLLLHVPVPAPPPITPANTTAGLLEHTLWSGPAFTVAAGLIVTTSDSVATEQGPLGSFVASV